MIKKEVMALINEQIKLSTKPLYLQDNVYRVRSNLAGTVSVNGCMGNTVRS